MALTRVSMPSPNMSSRSGNTVTTIVIHSTEGAQTLESLGNFFRNPSSQVSSHTGIDNVQAGRIGEYVQRPNNAWTAASANRWSIQTELCTPSGASAQWSTATWLSKTVMLANLAAWIAEEAAFFGIPIQRLTPAGAQNPATRGVCQHSDLGSMGGGHVDCGPGFPIDQVIAMANGSPSPTPPPAPTPTGSQENMMCVDPVTGGTWFVASREGAIYTGGGAPFLGGCNNTAMNAAKYPCVGIDLRPNADGFRLTLDWGPGKGDQSADGTGARFRTYDFPRNGSGIVKTGTY